MSELTNKQRNFITDSIKNLITKAKSQKHIADSIGVSGAAINQWKGKPPKGKNLHALYHYALSECMPNGAPTKELKDVEDSLSLVLTHDNRAHYKIDVSKLGQTVIDEEHSANSKMAYNLPFKLHFAVVRLAGRFMYKTMQYLKEGVKEDILLQQLNGTNFLLVNSNNANYDNGVYENRAVPCQRDSIETPAATSNVINGKFEKQQPIVKSQEGEISNRPSKSQSSSTSPRRKQVTPHVKQQERRGVLAQVLVNEKTDTVQKFCAATIKNLSTVGAWKQ
jgi:hypothetical protein